MTNPTNREREIFNAALDRATPAERAAYLDGACGQDAELRATIEGLIRAHDAAGGFLWADDSKSAAPGSPKTVPVLPALFTVTEKPGDRIGRYKLREKVGEGGCGVVYVAEQEEPVRRRVALKVIKLGMDTQSVIARFEAERQALAMMDHPNIAKVLDAGATEAGRPYFVMELVRGIKITDYCDRNKLSTRARLDLFIQVCMAVQHAHQKGIIHRDIKPSNILVTLHDGVPVPKIIDFGISKATEGRLTDLTVYTELHQFIGTPAYMSPEQAEMSGLDIDTRSDIYSLGVLLYELLTGGTPFDAKELVKSGLDEMRKIIRDFEPPRPSTRLSTMLDADLTAVAQRHGAESPKLVHLVRGDLDWIVMKSLEKDRTRRYETANGLARDIQRHLSNEPIVARPPSSLYRIQKTIQRNKLAFAATGAVAAALLLGLGFSSWQAVRATRSERKEQSARATAEQSRAAVQTERDKAQAAQKEAELSQQAEKQARLRADAEKAQAGKLLYVANMNLAQDAWEQNNVARVRQLLDDTATDPERGFEWYYWQRQTHLELKTLRGHSGEVWSVAVSPDRQRIVTGSSDKTAKVWDAASGKELLTLRGHADGIGAVAFSPDGHRIVTGSEDGTAKVWEAASGKELLTLEGHSDPTYSPDFHFIGHSGLIYSVAFSPDGQRIVTCDGGIAKVWDAASGKELLTLALAGHAARIQSVAFSPDGQRIVTGSWDQTAKVWEAASGKELLTLKGHSGLIYSVAFSPDSQRIVTGSWDYTAKVWGAVSGTELFTIKGHGYFIRSVSFSADGQQIVTASDDGTAKVWDASSEKELHTLKGHSYLISSVAFSPDGQRIVTGSGDGTAKVWEVGGGKELLTLKGHSGWINSVAFSPDGQRVVTGNEDQTAKVWGAVSGMELLTLKGHRDSVRSVAFSGDGQRILTGSWDKTAKVWNAASGTEILTLKGHRGRISSAAFSPDGQRIVTGSEDGTAKVWDAASGKELLTFKGHSRWIRSVAFSPDGQRIVTAGAGQTADEPAKVWEAASGKELLMLKGHLLAVDSVGFSPDGRRIVTGSVDGTVKVWEAASGRELLTLKGPRLPKNAVAFSPDGQRIVASTWDGTALVWEAATAQQVGAWQEEERVATQHLADLEHERTAEVERQQAARTRDSIKHWLVLAPIPLALGPTRMYGLDTEEIEGEARLRPKAGEPKSIGGSELKWREIAFTNGVIDFKTILGSEMTPGMAYAVCYLRSEVKQSGLQMLVAGDIAGKVYLNGKQVYEFPSRERSIIGESEVSDVALNAGLNVLVLKVVNAAEWKGSIRFTDAHGNPVKGVKVTLDPEAKG